MISVCANRLYHLFRSCMHSHFRFFQNCVQILREFLHLRFEALTFWLIIIFGDFQDNCEYTCNDFPDEESKCFSFRSTYTYVYKYIIDMHISVWNIIFVVLLFSFPLYAEMRTFLSQLYLSFTFARIWQTLLIDY